jgi:hypothetical protein
MVISIRKIRAPFAGVYDNKSVNQFVSPKYDRLLKATNSINPG